MAKPEPVKSPTADWTEERRWGELFLRWACKEQCQFSLKFQALAGPSMNTIDKFIRLQSHLDIDDDMKISREIDHKTVMLKAGLGMGLTAAQISLV